MSKAPYPSAFPVFSPRSAKSQILEEDIIEKLGGGKICDIPATSTKPRINVYPYWRPKKDLCLDYNLSQDHIAVDCRQAKIFVRKTDATYVWNPKPIIPKVNKWRYFNGIMPPGKFIDEMWMEKVNKKQDKYMSEMRRRLAIKMTRDREKRNRRAFSVLHRNIAVENFTIHHKQNSMKCTCTECLRYPPTPTKPDWC